jgi:hypothetical protein
MCKIIFISNIMKILIRTLVFHFVCILMFSLLYLNISNEMTSQDNNPVHFIDCLLLSTTIQAGVGFTNLSINSYIGKLIMMLQQLILISTHAFTLYIFTI